MLMGHNDTYADDVIMKVTVAFNHFGKGLNEWMPNAKVNILFKTLIFDISFPFVAAKEGHDIVSII